MKISELITQLQGVLKEKGDLEVMIDDITGDWGNQAATRLDYDDEFPDEITIGWGHRE